MTFVDTLLSSSRLVNRRVKLSTCAGLERHLIDELKSLSLKFNLVSRGKSYVDILTGLDTIWSIIHNSRICRQLFIHVCDPFDAETTKRFVKVLNDADWGSFIPFSHKLKIPSIKIISHNSKLYHTGMVRNMVERVINSHCHRYKQMQGDELPSFMKRRGYVPLCPKITVEINYNNCQVLFASLLFQILADASGDMSERPWHKLSLLDDRIASCASAAIIQELVSRGVLNNKTVIWDPFCHNGAFLFELSSYLKDQKIRTESTTCPLNNFPLSTLFYDHNHLPRNITYDYSLISNFYRFPKSSFSLIGTDPNPDNITCANDILNKINQLSIEESKLLLDEEDSSDLDRSDLIDLKFECNRINDVAISPKDTIVLTNLYYGNKAMKSEYSVYFKELLRFLKSIRTKGVEVYVVSPRSFRKNSRLKWETLMVFNNNGILVDLLKLLS